MSEKKKNEEKYKEKLKNKREKKMISPICIFHFQTLISKKEKENEIKMEKNKDW